MNSKEWQTISALVARAFSSEFDNEIITCVKKAQRILAAHGRSIADFLSCEDIKREGEPLSFQQRVRAQYKPVRNDLRSAWKANTWEGVVFLASASSVRQFGFREMINALQLHTHFMSKKEKAMFWQLDVEVSTLGIALSADSQTDLLLLAISVFSKKWNVALVFDQDATGQAYSDFQWIEWNHKTQGPAPPVV